MVIIVCVLELCAYVIKVELQTGLRMHLWTHIHACATKNVTAHIKTLARAAQ